MKVLFIIEDDFPMAGACTSLLNNIFFNGGMLEKIRTVDVLAVTNKYKEEQTELYNGINVHRLMMMHKLSTQEHKRLFAKHPFKVLNGIIYKTFLKFDSKIVKSGPVRQVYKKIKQIDTQSYDVVVAVFGYAEVVAAALSYKLKHPSSELVIYQVDPYSSNIVYPSNTRKERDEFEKKLYETADSIITTPILVEEAKGKYPEEIVSKMVSMEFPNVVPLDCPAKEQTGKINCMFTGHIYGNFRDPDYTLRLFDGVDSNIEFNIIGSVNAELKNKFSNHKVVYHGPKPLEETKTALRAADVLVNIGNSMTNQVPSKLFEYISYGKPIVNICKNRNCPTLPYLEKYPYALNLFEEDDIFDEQIKLLNGFILNNRSNRIPAEEIAKIYEPCTPQYCAQQMMNVFDKLTKD